jgi:signal transduction histidine kinase/CheY-like chemotaxis protein/CHASE3 domain sensor protein
LVFGLIVAVVAGRAFWSYVSFNRTLTVYNALVQDADRTEQAINDVSAIAIDLETGVRGWLLTGDADFREPYDRQAGRRAAALERLASAEQRDPQRRRLTDRVRTNLDLWNREVARPLLAPGSRALPAGQLLSLNREGRRYMDAVRADLAKLREALTRQREIDGSTLEAFRADLLDERWTFALGIAALLTGMAIVLLRGIEVPLAQLARQAREIGRGQLAPLQVGGVREARELAAAFSTMALRLAAERDQEQRFTDLVAALSAGGNLVTLAEVALHALVSDRQALGGVLWIARDPSAPMEAVAAVGLDRSRLVPGASPLANEVAATGRPARVDQLPANASHVVRSAFLDAVPRGLLAAPIRAGRSSMIGVLELAGPVAGPDPELDKALFRVGLALQNALAAEQTAALQTELGSANEELQAQNEELQAQEEELRVQREELVARQSELTERNEALQRASRHKTDFVSSMSHELRTPLNAVIGFADILLEGAYGNLEPAQVSAVSDIAAAGRQLLTLVNEILDLSKIEAGRIEVDVADIDLGPTVAEAVALVLPIAERARISVVHSIGPRLFRCTADRNRVRQVLVNLLANAVKFSVEGGVVDLSASRVAEGIRIEVSDHGVGISPDDQRHLFQPFTQLGEHGTSGTGLGLSISKRLVELMGGVMGVQSEPGRGSTFFFTLPEASSEPSGRVTLPARPVGPAAERSGSGILLVEDDPGDARVTESVLSRQGYRVRVATTAEAALNQLEEMVPAMVIIDLGLPGMSGFALIERIRANPRWDGIRLVVLTARDLSKAEEQQLSARVALVATKGIMTGAGFLETIGDLCGPELQGPRVLVIDDSQMNRRVVAAMLTPAGYRVVEAGNAAAGLDIAFGEPPAVILMDIRMPGMDGLEATARLRADARTRAVSIIALSAQAMPGDREKALEAGCVEYITKPVARHELLRAVGEAISRAKGQPAAAQPAGEPSIQ